MIRFLVSMAIFLASAAIGLLVANWVLPDLSITTSGFIVVVVIFAVLQAVLAPFFARTAERSAPALLGGVGLITTFIALFVTATVNSGLTIDGAATWFWATLIVWIVTMLATLLLPVILVKAGVEHARKNN